MSISTAFENFSHEYSVRDGNFAGFERELNDQCSPIYDDIACIEQQVLFYERVKSCSNVVKERAQQLSSYALLVPVSAFLHLIAKIIDFIAVRLKTYIQTSTKNRVYEKLETDVVRTPLKFISPDFPEGKTYFDRERTQEEQKIEQSNHFIEDILNTNDLRALPLLECAHQGIGFPATLWGCHLAHECREEIINFVHGEFATLELTYGSTCRKVQYTSQAQFLHFDENNSESRIAYQLTTMIDLNTCRITLMLTQAARDNETQ